MRLVPHDGGAIEETKRESAIAFARASFEKCLHARGFKEPAPPLEEFEAWRAFRKRMELRRWSKAETAEEARTRHAIDLEGDQVGGGRRVGPNEMSSRMEPGRGGGNLTRCAEKPVLNIRATADMLRNLPDWLEWTTPFRVTCAKVSGRYQENKDAFAQAMELDRLQQIAVWVAEQEKNFVATARTWNGRPRRDQLCVWEEGSPKRDYNFILDNAGRSAWVIEWTLDLANGGASCFKRAISIGNKPFAWINKPHQYHHHHQPTAASPAPTHQLLASSPAS
ncbi:hypothetical protein DFJ73DRAFT_961976 [Zopfochytrium polystomum]|nr:hypothetical protein DFJ73DRAFT_961976 [Zopfochytrium polystomum]